MEPIYWLEWLHFVSEQNGAVMYSHGLRYLPYWTGKFIQVETFANLILRVEESFAGGREFVDIGHFVRIGVSSNS